MDLNTLFSIGNLLVVPFWLLMIVAPRWPWAVRIIRSPLIAVLPALVYAATMLPLAAQMGGSLFASFSTLPGVASLLSTPQGALIGWVHFLCFDLFTGRWAYLDAIENKIPALLMAPVLFCIFMLGPVGLLMYLAVRGILGLMKGRAEVALQPAK
jgi:Domain of unknown function (DUF4281)